MDIKPMDTKRRTSNCFLSFAHLVTFLLIVLNGVEASTSSSRVRSIGAIIDVSSRVGREQKTALEVAIRNYNKSTENLKLSLYFRDAGGDPLHAASAAGELIKEHKVEVILGPNTWEEAGLVADVGSRARVPVISFTAPASAPPMASTRWPFLIRMANDGSEQVRCIAALVQSNNWRKVVIIYEDNVHGGESGNVDLLSKALQEVGSEIDYQLVLPPISSVSNPKEAVTEELVKLEKSVQSRVFIVLQSSLPMVSHLFGEAAEMGFVSRDSAWIIGNEVADYLDSFETSVISSMEGALGIRTYYPTYGTSYMNFKAEFRRAFRAEYPEEDDYQPGIQALRAYDSIRVIADAIERITNNISSHNSFLDAMLMSNFTGLSGQVWFSSGELSHSPVLRIVNVIGKKYKELDFWLPGFSKTLVRSHTSNINKNSSDLGGSNVGLSGTVIWPGDLIDRNPKGWAIPNVMKPMRIVVPRRTSFEKFVTFRDGEKKPEGFCIDLFFELLNHLNYSLAYEFFSHAGSYNEMIERVYDKTYDAVVGDITILSERSKYVEFTQPYAESGLSLIVRTDPEDSTWIILKPFNWRMWSASGVVFIYTMAVVWFMEHHVNDEFRGPYKYQITTALWFLSTSIFFAQREKIQGNLTKVVLVVWFVFVYILTSSYQASLTSMLTVQRMERQFSDIDYLKQNKLFVGCDDDSFILNYLQNVLHFDRDKIKLFDSDSNYTSEFESKGIAAAFLELPYEKLFIGQHCKSYASSQATYKFGGFAFAFQKGSPFASDFSRAILEVSEQGTLRTLEQKWLAPSADCSTTNSDSSIGTLNFRSFSGLYAVSIVTCTVCLVAFLVRIAKKSRPKQDQAMGENVGPWNRIMEIARYYHNGPEASSQVPRRGSTVKRSPEMGEWRSTTWEFVGSSDTQDHPETEASTPGEFEMLENGNSVVG